MNNKYVELEEWEKLRKSGAITEAEFENEKNKLLYEKREIKEVNTVLDNRIKVSKLIFIICTVLLVISIIFIIINIKNSRSENGDIQDELEYETAKEMYEFTGKEKYKNEMEKIERKMKKENMTENFYCYGMYLFGGATVILLAIGVIIKVKEKGGIKIVD